MIDPNKEYPIERYLVEVKKRVDFQIKMWTDFHKFITKTFSKIPGIIIQREINANQENLRLYKKQRGAMQLNSMNHIFSAKNTLKEIDRGERYGWK